MTHMQRSAAPVPGPRADRIGLILMLLCLCLPAPKASAAEEERWAILLTGISGEPELQNRFLNQLKRLRATLEGTMKFRSERIFVLFDDPAKDPGLVQFNSTRENLEKVCLEIAGKAGKDDLVFVFIAGHGSYDQNTYKLNLVGPDPSADEIARLLYAIPARQFVVVNATNSSGGSLAALSQKGAILVNATKSGMERNRTHLGEFFVEALESNNADIDKNGRVSVLEAFTYAAQKVEEYYAKEGNLRTEHPVLDDNGDGKGHEKPDPENGDGFLARTTYLDAGPPLLAQGSLTPEEQELALEAQALEKQIEALKYAKSEMAEAEYEDRLEELLLRLARINSKLRKK